MCCRCWSLLRCLLWLGMRVLWCTATLTFISATHKKQFPQHLEAGSLKKKKKRSAAMWFIEDTRTWTMLTERLLGSLPAEDDGRQLSRTVGLLQGTEFDHRRQWLKQLIKKHFIFCFVVAANSYIKTPQSFKSIVLKCDVATDETHNCVTQSRGLFIV